MNIKEAKEQIKNAMTAYFTKDEYGNFCIPIHAQRPVFMMGPPGIGKTAVMEQIASELGVGLVSYSMTHHTRQSALGLPFIIKKNYGGKEYDVSEYTMSEIIASVYEMIEITGKKEGILFLDEINCVSETLAPAMLQFLQYKIFGKHTVPEGWIVVTAGNPPEYNNSVREFDIATWDRLKRIDVEPDFSVWKEFAYKKGIHASIITYLEIKSDKFYKIETTVDGKKFVTARGWSDLSDMIILYEKNNIKVDESLIAQYIQDKKISKDFAIYYDLFNKYKSDYPVDTILSGNVDASIKKRASEGKFDERLALIGIILDAITTEIKTVYNAEITQTEFLQSLKNIKLVTSRTNIDITDAIEEQIESKRKEISVGLKSSSLSREHHGGLLACITVLNEAIAMIKKENPENNNAAFVLLKKDYDNRNKEMRKSSEKVGKELSNVFGFCEEVFGDGQEILILVTELTANYYSSHFISRYGCKEYFDHNKEMLFFERQAEIIQKMGDLDDIDDL